MAVLVISIMSAATPSVTNTKTMVNLDHPVRGEHLQAREHLRESSDTVNTKSDNSENQRKIDSIRRCKYIAIQSVAQGECSFRDEDLKG
jgi:hypothetical protein